MTRELYNPQTREQMLQRGRKIVAVGATLLAMLMGATTGALQGSLLFGVASAFVGFVAIFLVASRLLAFDMRPAVLCNSCPGTGWIRDLQTTRGRCPQCGGPEFAYRRTSLGAGSSPLSLDLDQIDGRTLVKLN